MGLFDLFKKKKRADKSEMCHEGLCVDLDEEDEEDENEYLSVYDAAEIWASNGKDEDYMFGYTEEELEDVL